MNYGVTLKSVVESSFFLSQRRKPTIMLKEAFYCMNHLLQAKYNGIKIFHSLSDPEMSVLVSEKNSVFY